ncbi:glutamine cyclotransferase [Chitinophaga costaii]|nr:glutamine cyclotransferase [Chitinophaga costaii]
MAASFFSCMFLAHSAYPQTIKSLFSASFMYKKLTVAAASLFFLASACHNNNASAPGNDSSSTATTTATTDNVPRFQADSAYNYVAKQVAFGPRIPNTPAQEACATWIINTVKPWADTVYVQRTNVTGPHHESLRCINVIASFNPAAKQRLLILAHWDTRPQADQDSGVNKNKRFDGADDGGSGVAVMLEVARHLYTQKIPATVGIDLLFADVEDSGISEIPDSYALGTQYWARHPHVPGYKANYGILLDMVGGKGSTFFMESTSKEKAYPQMKMFWDVANTLGSSDYFRYDDLGDPIDDDHVYVNNIAKIPTFDILAWQPSRNFAAHWHTTHDDMQIIDKATLHAVGQTLLQVIYTQPFNY